MTAKSNKAIKSRKYAAWSEKWEKSIKNGMKRAENEKTGCFADYLSYWWKIVDRKTINLKRKWKNVTGNRIESNKRVLFMQKRGV